MAHKILIVEDDQAICLMYKLKLSRAGYEVRVAMDGPDGLAAAQEMSPALILLDLKLPRMNGEVLLKKLRAETWGANIRVVVLTNISRDEAPSLLRFLNVDRYVVKAHSVPSEIVSIVGELLENEKSMKV